MLLRSHDPRSLTDDKCAPRQTGFFYGQSRYRSAPRDIRRCDRHVEDARDISRGYKRGTSQDRSNNGAVSRGESPPPRTQASSVRDKKADARKSCNIIRESFKVETVRTASFTTGHRRRTMPVLVVLHIVKRVCTRELRSAYKSTRQLLCLPRAKGAVYHFMLPEAFKSTSGCPPPLFQPLSPRDTKSVPEFRFRAEMSKSVAGVVKPKSKKERTRTKIS